MVKAKETEKDEEATASAKNKKSSGKPREETYKVQGEKVLGKVKELVKEGNVRRIIIKDKRGKVMVEFPMTLGVVGVVLAPTLAAIGALAALITECSITVEREVKN